jgi:hypothetical protein
VSSSITISRDSGYADRIRSYRVVVDDLEIGKINNGESKTFSIEPGAHHLVLKIDWCSSNTVLFDLPPDGTMHFECGSNLRGVNLFLGIYYAFFARDQYLWLSNPIRQ